MGVGLKHRLSRDTITDIPRVTVNGSEIIGVEALWYDPVEIW